VLGICGGFQMLGETIADPHGIEGEAGSSRGLGLLAIDTVLEKEKQLRRVSGRLTMENAAVSGYEIHAGVTRGAGLQKPLVDLGEHSDGAIDETGQIAGTYLHGLFDDDNARDALLRWAGLDVIAPFDYHARREADIDRLADAMEHSLDLDALLSQPTPPAK
jgi:adenosylcobyric acid synthase